VVLAVQLQTNQSSNNIELSWSATPDWVPQASESAGANWVTLTNAPIISNDLNVLILPGTNQQRFFRLKKL
jgi:hypothetical protein